MKLRFRHVTALLLLVQLSAAMVSCSVEPSEPKEDLAAKETARTHSGPPSIILISIDTLGRDHLTEAPTPRLDAFASGASRFTDAHAPGSWTLPSHASIMTGLYPDHHGAVAALASLPEATPTLAARLAEQGYETVGFTDGGFLSQDFGMDSGFQFYDGAGELTGRWLEGLPREGKGSGEESGQIFDRAIHLLEHRTETGKPLFLFLHTYSVHDYFKQHTEALQLAGYAEDLELSRQFKGCVNGRRQCAKQDWQRLYALYLAEIRRVDHGFGKLLDAIALHLPPGNTVVVLTSDHGESFEWEEGRVHHGGRLTPDQLDVPLFIAGYGVEGEYETPVSLVDLAPTLLEIAGATALDIVDGISLAQLMNSGVPLERRQPLWGMEYFFYWKDGVRRQNNGPPSRPLQVALIQDGLRFIRDYQTESSSPPVIPPRIENLIAGRAHALPERTSQSEIEGETRKQLEALGYVDE